MYQDKRSDLFSSEFFYFYFYHTMRFFPSSLNPENCLHYNPLILTLCLLSLLIHMNNGLLNKSVIDHISVIKKICLWLDVDYNQFIFMTQNILWTICLKQSINRIGQGKYGIFMIPKFLKLQDKRFMLQ